MSARKYTGNHFLPGSEKIKDPPCFVRQEGEVVCEHCDCVYHPQMNAEIRQAYLECPCACHEALRFLWNKHP